MAGGRLAWGLGVAKQPALDVEAEPARDEILLVNWPLVPHPSTPTDAVDGIAVSVGRTAERNLAFEFRIQGRIDALVFPPKSIASRADSLWRTTCCEAFLKPVGQSAYVEYNLSPSTRWAAYRFPDYRDGMRVVASGKKPAITFALEEDDAVLRAQVDLVGMSSSFAEAALNIGLSAVIEERGGARSFWALGHPEGKPDFHHAESFALSIGAPRL